MLYVWFSIKTSPLLPFKTPLIAIFPLPAFSINIKSSEETFALTVMPPVVLFEAETITFLPEMFPDFKLMPALSVVIINFSRASMFPFVSMPLLPEFWI